jgi:hypothetical protein
MTDEDKISGRLHGEQVEPDGPEPLILRIVYLVLIGFMVSVSQTILGALTIIQLIVMVLNKGTPNPALADFGTDLGVWMAKAVRYMSAASRVKPWPWSELD